MKRKATVKLKAVFASEDLESSVRDATALKQKLDELLDDLKPQSCLEFKNVSFHSNPLPLVKAMVEALNKSDNQEK